MAAKHYYPWVEEIGSKKTENNNFKLFYEIYNYRQIIVTIHETKFKINDSITNIAQSLIITIGSRITTN